MRGSLSSAAASARRAISIFSSGERSSLLSSRSRSGTRSINAEGSGSPACGSSAVILASAVASSTTRSRDSRERSEVDAAADARPAKTRRARRCSREWLRVSISPIRTDAPKRLSSTRKPSAAVAPRCAARLSTETRRSVFIVAMSVSPAPTEGGLSQARPGSAAPASSVAPPANPARSEGGLRKELVAPTRPASYGRSADGDAVDADRREPDAHRHGLAVLAARPNTLVELQVATDTRDAREGLGAVPDQRRPFDRRRDASVLDQVRLARREDELPVRDVHLAAAEGHGVEAVLHRFHNFLGIVLPGQHERVGHPRHRRIGVGLAAPVAGRLHAHEPRVQLVLHVAGQDPVLDEDGPAGWRALVVDVERATAIRDRP